MYAGKQAYMVVNVLNAWSDVSYTSSSYIIVEWFGAKERPFIADQYNIGVSDS